MKMNSPQQQVWRHLRNDEQRTVVAENLRHLKHRTQEDICYGILAYLRWGIVRPIEDPWVKRTHDAIILYLKAERTLGHI